MGKVPFERIGVLQDLKGTYVATRVDEWQSCTQPPERRTGFFVIDFGADGRYLHHHIPTAFGQVRPTSKQGVFEGNYYLTGMHFKLTLTLESPTEVTWALTLKTTFSWLFRRMSRDEKVATPGGVFLLTFPHTFLLFPWGRGGEVRALFD